MDAIKALLIAALTISVSIPTTSAAPFHPQQPSCRFSTASIHHSRRLGARFRAALLAAGRARAVDALDVGAVDGILRQCL
jgi:hypothetical protein